MHLSENEILRRVRRVEIKTRGLSDEIFAGKYHTAFRGRGMSFSEVREYRVGDDAGNIQELQEKPILRSWWQKGLFERFVLIKKGEKGMRIFEIYNHRWEKLC